MDENILIYLSSNFLAILSIVLTVLVAVITGIIGIMKKVREKKKKYITYCINRPEMVLEIPKVKFIYDDNEIRYFWRTKIKIKNDGLTDIVSTDFADTQKIKISINKPKEFISYQEDIYSFNGVISQQNSLLLIDLDYLKKGEDFDIILYSTEQTKYSVQGQITNGRLKDKSNKIEVKDFWTNYFSIIFLINVYSLFNKMIHNALNVEVRSNISNYDLVVSGIFLVLLLWSFYREHLKQLFDLRRELKRFKKNH